MVTLQAVEMRRKAAALALCALFASAATQPRPPKLPVVPSAERARYAPAADPVGSVEAYKRVLADAVLDPTLDLFTPGSRVLRARRPEPAGEMPRAGAALEAMGALHVQVLRDRAVVSPEVSKPGALPVLLQRIDGTWRIDQVEMEKALGLDKARNVVQRDDETPYAFGIRGQSVALFADLGSVDLFGEDPADALARLEHAKKTTGTELRLAEILLRNCWLVDEALPHYEEVLRLAPDDWRIASTYARRAIFLGIGDRAIPVLKRFGPKADRLLGDIHAQAKRFDQSQDYWWRADLYQLRRELPPAPARPPETIPTAKPRPAEST